VPEVDTRVVIDGVLNDDVWSKALTLELGYETRPGENLPAPVRTEALVASSKTHFYIAFRAHDPNPPQICASICDRDNMFDDDRVSFILDTFNDHRRGYMFFLNPLGIQGDALDSTGTGAGDPSWDTIWESEGRITDEGYVVEAAIPFSSLRFQRSEGEQTWGLGLGRKYSRSTDYRMAHTSRDRSESCYLCQVAKIAGFSGATPGRNIELDPTVAGFIREEREWFPNGDFEEAGSESDLGLTARWGVTPNLVLSGAVNPDFSQVEADAFQLDVNAQFALFYEEKRPFFLEGMELFQGSLDPVYTRTIADPAWGVKLTGKEGANGIGVFATRDELTNILLPGSQGSSGATLDGASTAAVVRYRRDIGEASTVGLFLTGRESDGYRNGVAGIDGNLRLSPSNRLEFQVLGSQTAYPKSFALAYGQPTERLDGAAYDVEFNHDGRSLNWWLAYREIQDEFRADLGFRPRSDFRQARGGWGYTWWRDAGHWFSSMNTGFGYVHNEERDGELLDSFFDYWFDYDGPLRSNVHVYGVLGREQYRGIEYDDRYVWLSAGAWPTGTIHVRVEGLVGDAIDYTNARPGDRVQIGPLLQLKVGRRLDLVLAHTYERLDVGPGRLYTANVSYVRAAYQFTRRAFLRAIVQHLDYDFNTDLYSDGRGPEFRQLASQVLFSYKLNPQTVLYLGYSDNHFGFESVDVAQNDRTFFAKIGYAWVL